MRKLSSLFLIVLGEELKVRKLLYNSLAKLSKEYFLFFLETFQKGENWFSRTS